MVDICGNALLRSGLVRGDRVLIRSSNCPEYLTTFLAALKIGCVPIPTNSLFRSWELEHILRNSGARAAFTTTELLEPIRVMRERARLADHCHVRRIGRRWKRVICCIRGGRVAGARRRRYQQCRPRVHHLYVGDHGRAQGRRARPPMDCCDRISNYAAADAALARRHLLQSARDQFHLRARLQLPLSVPQRRGDCDDTADDSIREGTLAAIDRLKPTVLIAVPTLFRRLLALGEALKSYDLSSLRMGMSSGEPLPEDTLRSAREWLGMRSTTASVRPRCTSS